jgi:hypothetical protein
MLQVPQAVARLKTITNKEDNFMNKLKENW